MTTGIIVTVIFIHLFTAIFQLASWKKTTFQGWLSVTGSFLALAAAVILFARVYTEGTLTLQAANWDAPFGIVFVADLFSATLVLLTSLAGFSISMFSTVGIGPHRKEYGYFPIFHFLIMGLIGAFLTGDIFNLYVWFEVIIIASFVLMTLGGRKAQLEGAVKYMALNILASTFFLTGIGLLYGLTGSLNMADLSQKIALIDKPYILDLVSVFFLLGFGTKSAVFPLYFWLPSSYHTPPSAVAAAFGGLLTKVGVYAMIRVFTLVFVPSDFIKWMLVGLAVFTIITGALGAIGKDNIRKLFSYLIICHIGYMIGGLGVFSTTAIMGAIVYLIHDIVVKTNLFLIAGLIRQVRGTMTINKLGGLYTQYPKISIIMAIVLFSLVGIPPLSGFWSKIYLFEASYESSNYLFLGSLIFGSFVTLFVIARLWANVFWKQQTIEHEESDKFILMSPFKRSMLVIPIGILATMSLFIGFNIEFIIQLAERITDELLDTSSYINAVLR